MSPWEHLWCSTGSKCCVAQVPLHLDIVWSVVLKSTLMVVPVDEKGQVGTWCGDILGCCWKQQGGGMELRNPPTILLNSVLW